MQQVAPGTWRLGTRSHNFYVLRDGDVATLIDAGCSREWAELEGGLAEIGLTLDALEGIVVTHSHADHFGLAKRAQDEGVAVAVHEDEESRALGTYQGRYAVGTRELPLFNWRMLRHFWPIMRAGVMKLDHVEQVGTFGDGDELDLPGRPVAIHTPGHTEGHVMFHCPERGLLFTGDGLATMDLLGSAQGPQLMDGRFHVDAGMAEASLDRIVELPANLLLPGHGEPWQGSPADAVVAARR